MANTTRANWLICVPGGLSANKKTGFSETNAWANPGYATTGTATTDVFLVDPAEHDFDLMNLNSFVFVVRCKGSTPASTKTVLGSYQLGTTTGGISLQARSSGQLSLVMNTTDNSTVQGFSSVVALDGNEHTHVFVVSSDTSLSFYGATDGLYASGVGKTAIDGKDLKGGHNLCIGSVEGTNPPQVMQWGSVQMYIVPFKLGLNLIEHLYKWPVRHPDLSIPDWLFEAKG